MSRVYWGSGYTLPGGDGGGGGGCTVGTDPGTGNPIVAAADTYIPITTGVGAETNTLPDPAAACISLVISMSIDGGGDRVITAASDITLDGRDTITFDTQGSFIKLESILANDLPVWRVIAAEGVTLS